MVPGDLRYTKEHEWVRVDGDEAVVGITQFAADQLGDIVFVELPAAGKALDRHATFGVVESVKAVSDLFAPGRRRGHRGQRRPGRLARAREQRPVRRGLDAAHQARRPGAGRGAPRRRRLRAARRRGLTDAVRPARGRRSGADARGDRHRFGRRPVRGHPRGPAGRTPGAWTSPSPSSCSPRGCRRWRPATAWTWPRSWAPARTATGRPRSWTRCSSAASGTRPTRRTSRRSRQGTLQSIYEYQSLLAELTGLDVVSASHYDGGAATAEAALMTCRATRRERILVSRAVHPALPGDAGDLRGGGGPRRRRDPARRRRARSPGRRISRRWSASWPRPDRPVAGVVAAQPNVLGLLEDMPEIGRLAHAAGALFVAVIEPVSLAVLAPPGEYGADIAAGEGQPLGIPLGLRRPLPRDRRLHGSAGPPDPGPSRGHDRGPRREARVRDDDAGPRAGHPAREGGIQHLHQPGAARAGGVHLPVRDRPARVARRGGHRRGPRRGAGGGPRGRRGAPAARRRRTSTSSSSGCPDARAVHARLLERGILAGIPTADLLPDEPSLADGLLVCATEVTTSDEIARFAAALAAELAVAVPGGAA